jgi:aspartyl-tRNA(Asn)/glutamyl-tRNA(Gln) amidotransferase subunit A
MTSNRIVDEGSASDTRLDAVDRRTAVKAIAAAAAVASVPGLSASALAAAQTTELTWMPAWRIRELIAKREVSAVEVTEHFLGRIEALDPKVHAFRAIDYAGAREQAKQADAAQRKGETLGPLHGIPVSVKDGNAVKGLTLLTFTSAETALEPKVAEHDDILVERLRKAGAIVTGVNIMPGQGTGPGMPDLKGHPRNPWDLSRAPGSSSAGSAAAAAAAMVPFTIGGDGGGSTRLPAALSGVLGLHTTPGRIAGVDYAMPIIALLDGSRGPMTRDARDAAIAMQVIAGPDGRDPLSTLQGPVPDYLAELDRGVEGMRFAWTDDFGFAANPMHTVPQSPKIIAAIRDAAQGFGKIGASVEPIKDTWETFWPPALVTRQGFGGLGSSDQKVTPDQLRSALDVRQRNWDRFDRLLRTHDLLLTPTATFTARTVEEWQELCHTQMKWWPVYTSHTFMFNWLGMPAASVPCGFVDGLPIGLQIVGRPHSEAKILRVAAAFMKAFPRNERPKLA